MHGERIGENTGTPSQVVLECIHAWVWIDALVRADQVHREGLHRLGCIDVSHSIRLCPCACLQSVPFMLNIIHVMLFELDLCEKPDQRKRKGCTVSMSSS